MTGALGRRHRTTRTALSVMLLSLALGSAPGCDDAEVPTTADQTRSTSTTASPPTTATTLPTTTVGAPGPGVWDQVEAPDVSDLWSVRMSGDVLVVTTQEGTLLVGAPGSAALEELPTEGRVQDVDVEGSVVAWTEYVDEDLSATALYTYVLPDGPKRRVDVRGTAMNPRLDGGRLFWSERIHVQGEPFGDETVYDLHTIWTVPLDDRGLPAFAPATVTDRPDSSHEPGGDEIWDFDVAGSVLVYERDWGVGPGVYALDLETDATTYLGWGDIPSVSESLVAWRHVGEQGFSVHALDLATRRVTSLAASAHMPFAGPGYVVYVRGRAADPSVEEIVVLDEASGREVVAGERVAADGYPYVSIAGTEEHLAWVTDFAEESRLRVFRRVPAEPADTSPPRDIWADSSPPPMPTDASPWPARDGWTVIVASVPDSGPASEIVAWEKTWRLVPDTLLPMLHSDDYPTLEPGYWVVFSGVFDTRAEAESHLSQVRALGVTDAYVREVRVR